MRATRAVLCLVSLWVVSAAVREGHAPSLHAESDVHADARHVGSTNRSAGVQVYLGLGCFWARQWASYAIETDPHGPFARSSTESTAIAGYAGGSTPSSGAVCYGNEGGQSYASLGHAEVVQLTLDASRAEAQLRALAADYFAAFHGGSGQRFRPDVQDVGDQYRALIGLPGGASSSLYGAFAAENDARSGMTLPTGAGGDADRWNTVYVMDTAAFPFFPAEVYHQNRCDFEMSPGMPYPDSYVLDAWKAKRAAGAYAPTGCHEDEQPRYSCPSEISGPVSEAPGARSRWRGSRR